MKDLDKLKVAVSAILGADLPTQEGIRKCIGQLRRSFPGVTDEEANELALRFEEMHGVKMRDGAALQDTGFEPWLEDARVGLDPYYWGRYHELLVSKDFSAHVLATLDDVTDRILGFLENPTRPGEWDRRGMVVGHVQSGKTANYTGLVCKAADAGYKVIVIIAGIHNNLRNQTQRRIDEGFVGIDSSSKLLRKTLPNQATVGVGRFDSRHPPATFTTSRRDFNKAIADSVGVPLQSLVRPAVFVIKKHTSTLRNLIEWLTAHNAQRGTSTIREPMLLIDDEADNASINIRHRQDQVSRINSQIRQLLQLFERSCYVGYTATPFANIFVDPDSVDEMLGHDLFPRDFIVSLDPPDNYFGATKVFSDDAERIVRHIDDHADVLPLKHPKEHRVTELPESLETAVRVFVVARAIRLARGHLRRHNSMLVNVSRFVAVQGQIRNEIHALVGRIRSSARVNGALPPAQAMADSEIAALCQAFEEHYADSGISWADVQSRLHESASAVNVVEVNSRAAGSLDYAAHEASGLNVIAVGGFSLSRGLTLEGLVVSYFLRNSMMYDTLLQMGRWFGYRRGYEDLCRVWMPEEAQGWYTHIAESIEELRDELARMQSVNATPKDFGLRVRSHPDTLVVTARNKMGTGRSLRVLIGLANHFVETAILRRDRPTLRANRQAAITLAGQLRRSGFPPEQGEQVGGGRLVRCVPVQFVDAFLLAFRNHEGSAITETEPVREYIRQRRADELREWDILFAGVTRKQASAKPLDDSSLGFPLICQRRGMGQRSDDATLMITNKQRVSSRGIARMGVDDDDARKAEDEYDANNATATRRANYPDRIYGPVRKRALLVVHLLAIGAAGDDLRGQEPVVAWSISFPATSREEEKVEYVVNTTWEREHYAEDDEEEDAGDGA